MNWLTQCTVVTLMTLRTIPQRLGSSLTAAVGVALVVMVMVALLSIAEGFNKTLARTGADDTALVMRSGTDSEMSSSLSLDQARIVADAPGIRRDAGGATSSAELFVIVDIPKRTTGTEANVPLRGVQSSAFEIRQAVRIVEGRRFEPGRNEIIAGVGAAQEFAGLELGNVLRWGENEWTVVGLFEAGGGLAESELWCDVNVLQPAYRRTMFQSVRAKLESAEAFGAFKDALTTDERLQVKVIREPEYFASQSEQMNQLIIGLGTPIIFLMGCGAVFGAIITMYSAVAARIREIATLRALGFGGGPAVVAVLVESMALAAAGGLLGGIVAYLGFNGFRTATLNWASFSQVVFAFAVTPRLIGLGIAAALVIGLIAGLFPAIRAARIPVAIALREL